MAAGQQRKRLASSNLHELQGKKKKRLESSDYILNLRSHVHLQWDDDQKRVVAKREQIGITWKVMSLYVDSVPKFHSCLADVFSFPKEVFDLDNLMEVLSHKVWLTCLSVSERKLLMQFLPSCAFAEQAVQSLLTGENLHFGNPLLKWSTLLCSSDLHPDVLLRKERQTRVSKKQYNLELNKYHTNMVAVLRTFKEISETCEDPEKLWRKLSTLTDSGEGVGIEKLNDHFIQKKELPLKMCNQSVDVAKYMSYIKVNKKQFKLLEGLKHSGDHIQSKSISRVLGDIKKFHIYPYESFEDEENNKLREHWMQVTKDTLAAFEKYNKGKFLKMQQMECLEKELAESRTLIHDKAEESVLGNSPEDHIKVDRETERQSIAISAEDAFFHSISPHDHTLEHITSLDNRSELDSSIFDQETRNECALKPAKDELASSQSADKMDSCQMVKEPKALISPSISTWISANFQSSNYQNPSETHLFSSSDPPLDQCQHFKAQPALMINPEREIIEQYAGRPLSSAFNVKATSQLFSSYSQIHDEVIPTFPMPSQMHDLSQTRPQFLTNGEILPESDRLSLLDNNRRNLIDRTMFRYNNHSGYYPSSNSRCNLQSSVNDGLGKQSWFCNEYLSHNVWPGIESSGSPVRGGCADGSLLGALPEFRHLPRRSSFDTSGSERFGTNLADPHIPTQVSSSTGLSSAPFPSFDMIWNSRSLQESVKKPFMRHSHQ